MMTQVDPSIEHYKTCSEQRSRGSILHFRNEKFCTLQLIWLLWIVLIRLVFTRDSEWNFRRYCDVSR